MAASFRSVSEAVDSAGTANSLVINKPAGAVDGDGLVLFIGTVDPSPAVTHTTPTGFDLRGTFTASAFGGAYQTRVSVYTRVASSEPADYTLNASGATFWACDLVAVQDVDPADLFEVIGSSTSGNGTAITLPAVTTGNANGFLLGFASCNGAGAGSTFTSSALTERSDANSTFIGTTLQASAGSSGNKLVTAGTSGDYIGVLVAINSAVASGNTIAVPGGSLALTGLAPTVTATANQTISVPLATMTLTGFAPSVIVNNIIAVPSGSLTLTGNAPTVAATANNTISVPLGSLTLTGQTPTVSVTANNLIDVPAGALTLTGLVPTVQNGANHTIAVPAGSLSLTGFEPSIVQTANQVIAVPTGNLLLTGNAPTVEVSNHQIVPVPLGNLTLTGFAPNVDTGGPQLIDVPLGVLSLTVYPPTVTASHPQAEQPSGGYWYDFEYVRERRRRQKKRREEREAELKAIQDETDREIAALLRRQEAEDERRKDLERLQILVDRYQSERNTLPDRVSQAMQKALEQRSSLALEQFYRAVNQTMEEEEAAVILTLLLD